LFSALFLTRNFLIRVDYVEEAYPIKDYYYSGNEIVFQLQGNAYQEYTSVRRISGKEPRDKISDKYLKLKFAQGVFGYNYHLRTELVAKNSPAGE
jgi:hypothetical protein